MMAEIAESVTLMQSHNFDIHSVEINKAKGNLPNALND